MGRDDYFDEKNRYNEDYEEKIRKRNPAVIAFVLTLSTVLVVGIPTLFALDNITKGKVNDENPLLSKWEIIPEGARVEIVTDDKLVEEEDEPRVYIYEGDEDYTHIVEAANSDYVTIGFAGDILFDDNYAAGNAFKTKGNSPYGIIGESLLERMKSADIMMVNNEFPYSLGGSPTEGKTYTFRARPETVSILDEMGVDIVGLANNHCYDYGPQAFLDTITTLKGAGIVYAGAGNNIEEASHPVYYVTDNGMKIAFICATQIERLSNPDTKGATSDSPGVFRCLDDTLLLEKIREAKERDAYVIVFIHWGTESTEEIDYLQRDQSREIVSAGADLIIGAHPHVLQKIEYVDGVPVFYSLGNYMFNSKTLDTCLVMARIYKDGTSKLQFVPAVQSGCTVNEATGAEAHRILEHMKQMSPGVSFDENGYLNP